MSGKNRLFKSGITIRLQWDFAGAGFLLDLEKVLDSGRTALICNSDNWLAGRRVGTDDVLHFLCVRVLKAHAQRPKPQPFVGFRCAEAVYYRHSLTFQLQHCNTKHSPSPLINISIPTVDTEQLRAIKATFMTTGPLSHDWIVVELLLFSVIFICIVDFIPQLQFYKHHYLITCLFNQPTPTCLQHSQFINILKPSQKHTNSMSSDINA